MLKLSLFEFVFRSIPEAFIFVLGVHAFSKTSINLKKYLIASILFSISVYLIRLLPIQYGIHTILSLISIIVLVIWINKINTIKCISSGIVIFIISFVLEGLNIAFVQFVLKKNLNKIMGEPILKTLLGIPSIIIIGVFVIAYYFKVSQGKELKYV